jgi:hypothetical protein
VRKCEHTGEFAEGLESLFDRDLTLEERASLFRVAEVLNLIGNALVK